VVLDSDESQHVSYSSPVKSFETENVTIDSFDSYYKTLLGYLMEQHWLATETAAPLLSLQHDHCRCPFLLIDDVNEAYPNRLCVDNIFDDIVLMHLSAGFYVKKKKYYTAYNLQLAIINTFSKEILQKEKDSNWYIPLLGVFCSDLILLAKKSEEQDHDLDPEPYMEDVANVIMGLYRQCVADNRTDLQVSKKVAIVPLTVRLFKLYFETNKMALLKPLIRAIDYLNPCFLNLISLSDLVAYNYFLGKKAIFDGDMQTANKALEHAFLHCPDRFRSNKRNILIYWLPVKMCLGCVPTTNVLKEFDLIEFDPIVEGVNHGDIEAYRRGLARHSHFFMKSGIFLILEKLISLTYLALLKRVVNILNDGSFHIKLEPFLHCLKAAGEEIADLDEAGNIVAGLIADGKVKGYISQSHQTMVLSKKDAFPSLGS